MKAVDVEPGAVVGSRDAGWRSVGRSAEIVDTYFQGDDPLFVLGCFDGAQNRPMRTWWSCSICGPNPRSRSNWCEAGCGRDYQQMTEIQGVEDEQYALGHEYGRYLLCFENPTLYLAVAKEGSDTLGSPTGISQETISKIPPKVKRNRYNVFGELEEDEDND